MRHATARRLPTRQSADRHIGHSAGTTPSMRTAREVVRSGPIEGQAHSPGLVPPDPGALELLYFAAVHLWPGNSLGPGGAVSRRLAASSRPCRSIGCCPGSAGRLLWANVGSRSHSRTSIWVPSSSASGMPRYARSATKRRRETGASPHELR